MLEVRLLGAFEVKRDSKTVTIPSRPAQSLFAYLILTAGTAHRREKLAGLLWPDSDEESARDYLRHGLWRIRKSIGAVSARGKEAPYILADDINIGFNASSPYSLDAMTVERVVDSASTDELMGTLSFYGGELLPGFYDEWILLEREHLRAVYEHKMARLMSVLEDETRWLDILDWGERWIAFGQKPEPAYRALMSAHAAKGDMSKVAAVYERCVKSLKEFEVEPSEQTVKLYEGLKAGQGVSAEIPLRGQKQAQVKKEAGVRSSIPIPLTSFIGRERELKDIARLLAASRLLTMIGPGGVGKTRLAIQTAHDSIKKFKDGVCWVELVGLQDGALIPQQIAQALDVREVSNQPMLETLRSLLKSKEALLVLDNCEHLIEACAQVVESLLAACPKLKILATSRERFDLFNETTWNVPSLPLPEMGRLLALSQLREFASIELFVERAGNVKSDFLLTEQSASSVAQICNHLDGIPLAIELASARVKVLTVDEIASRLNDRFSLLTSGSRTALPRQQTLHATFDWSHDLLTEPEQILFRRLAVFAGGFALKAAEVVCGHGELKRNEILDLLGRLADKSLVIVEAPPSGETRYRWLETIREYAFEKLVESKDADIIRDRHLEFFTKLAEETELHLYAPEQAEWFARAETEIDNMRAALDWSTTDTQNANDARIRNGLQLAGVLAWFWEKGYSYEFSVRLRYMLSRKNAGMQSVERARALNAAGFLHWTLGNIAEAHAYLVEALSIGRTHADKLTLSWTLSYLGSVLNGREEYASAQALLEESVAITKGLGNMGKAVAGATHSWIGDIYLARNDEVRAMEFYEKGAQLLRETHNTNILAYAVRRVGYLVLKQANYERARNLFKESLIYNREVGHQPGMTASIAGLAKLAYLEGNLARAAHLFGIVEGRTTALGAPLTIMDNTELNRSIPLLRAQMDEESLNKYWAKGTAMTMEQAVAFVMEET